MHKVQILLSTYNGEKYLKEQIDSLLNQKDVFTDILVRDDGSGDNTKKILEKYRSEGYLSWYEGDNLGSAKSFMDIVSKSSGADFYAFCDQDDVWLPQKLKMAVELLNRFNQEEPALYFSNTIVTNSELKPLSSNTIKTLRTFGESLIRNSAVGCTVVFNAKLLHYLQLYNPLHLLMHDRWTYQLCLALNGNVYFDQNAYIKYRQHDYNVVGREIFIDKLKRRYKIFFKNKKNTRLLNVESIWAGYKDILSDDNRKLLENIINYNKKSFKTKLKIIFNGKYKTANIGSNIGFIVSILFNKF